MITLRAKKALLILTGWLLCHIGHTALHAMETLTNPSDTISLATIKQFLDSPTIPKDIKTCIAQYIINTPDAEAILQQYFKPRLTHSITPSTLQGIHSFALSPNGQSLAFIHTTNDQGSFVPELQIWDISKNELQHKEILRINARFFVMRFDPTSKKLVIATGRSLYVVDIPTKKHCETRTKMLDIGSIQFDTTLPSLIALAGSGCIQIGMLTDNDSFVEKFTHKVAQQEHPEVGFLSQQDTIVFTGSAGIGCVNFSTGNTEEGIKTSTPRALLVIPDTNTFVTIGEKDETCRVWKMTSKVAKNAFTCLKTFSLRDTYNEFDHSYHPQVLSDDKLLYLTPTAVYCRHLTTGEKLWELQRKTTDLSQIAHTQAHANVLTIKEDKYIDIYRLFTLKKGKNLPLALALKLYSMRKQSNS